MSLSEKLHTLFDEAEGTDKPKADTFWEMRDDALALEGQIQTDYTKEAYDRVLRFFGCPIEDPEWEDVVSVLQEYNEIACEMQRLQHVTDDAFEPVARVDDLLNAIGAHNIAEALEKVRVLL